MVWTEGEVKGENWKVTLPKKFQKDILDKIFFDRGGATKLTVTMYFILFGSVLKCLCVIWFLEPVSVDSWDEDYER